ncbi:MAG: DUF177 domain-containing protein [Alphaproteobacteria bacterium]|jgi:uncharacterized metal-binding protein YceD (DUF177 family)
MTKKASQSPTMTKTTAVPEFSRLHPIHANMERLANGEPFELIADEDERAALAKRFDLLSCDAFVVTGVIHVFDGGAIARVEGSIKGDVVQACIVTLAPVAAHIEESFTVSFENSAKSDVINENREVALDMNLEEEIVEPMTDEGIDLGEAAAELLGVSLEPYPRSEDAEFSAEATESTESTETGDPDSEKAAASPFSVLKQLKKR